MASDLTNKERQRLTMISDTLDQMRGYIADMAANNTVGTETHTHLDDARWSVASAVETLGQLLKD